MRVQERMSKDLTLLDGTTEAKVQGQEAGKRRCGAARISKWRRCDEERARRRGSNCEQSTRIRDAMLLVGMISLLNGQLALESRCLVQP